MPMIRPDSVQICSYADMKKIVNKVLREEVKENRIAIAKSIIPPKYDKDNLVIEYQSIWRRFNALSGKNFPFEYRGRLLDFYYVLYETGMAYEQNEDYDRALDYYLLTIFNCCPTGTVYYERPAIIFERQQRYIQALMICDLADRAYTMSRGEYAPGFDKRRLRLLKRAASAAVEWPEDQYPISCPPMPLRWGYDDGSLTIEEAAEYLRRLS